MGLPRDLPAVLSLACLKSAVLMRPTPNSLFLDLYLPEYIWNHLDMVSLGITFSNFETEHHLGQPALRPGHSGFTIFTSELPGQFAKQFAKPIPKVPLVPPIGIGYIG